MSIGTLFPNVSMTTQRTHQTISSVGNTIAEDLKNSGRELNLSAFNGSTQPQSHVINQDIIVIQGGGGRGQTITTVGTKQLQGWSFVLTSRLAKKIVQMRQERQ
jgi:hypothetical protein